MVDSLLFGITFLLGGVAGVLFLLKPMMSRANRGGVAGILKFKKHRYSYEMGDNIMRLGVGVFAGTDIHLPKRLPHIFFDAYAGERSRPPAGFIFPDDEPIPTGGDNDGGFRIFAPKAYKQLVQTIFTPELIKELQGTDYRYDIELFDRHVRIIVPIEGVLVGGNKILQNDMARTAKILMKAVDHHLESWHEPAVDKNPRSPKN
jgi:hypothetical protein